MGYAERLNPKSSWNKKRASRVDFSASTQTTQKENFNQVSTPRRDEPVVIEFSQLWGNLCRRLKTLLRPQSPAPTN